MVEMTEAEPTEDGERFAHWSGYAPGKERPDGDVTALDRDELREEELRLRRGADRARQLGDTSKAEHLLQAADDLHARAERADR
jgi:hypothetical protein